MHQIRNRKFTIFIAGGMAAVLISLGVCLNVERVQAKDTLPGIGTVVSSATKEKPYTILEIVPDVATTTGFADGTLVTGYSIIQSMGMIGYYIGGQEPIQLTKDLLLFNTAEARKDYVNRLYHKSDDGTVTGALKDITDNFTDANITKPLTFQEYKEVYAFERSLTEIEDGLAKGTLKQLKYNELSTTEPTEPVTEHIETVTGYKREVMSGDTALTGNLIKQYVRTENETEDPALRFFEGGEKGSTPSSAFEDVSAQSDGDFDPGFKSGSDYFVKFSETGGRVGYVPVSSSIETVPVGKPWTEEIAEAWEGKPVYQCDENGVYTYVGTVQKRQSTGDSGTNDVIGVKEDDAEENVWRASVGAEFNVAVLSLGTTVTPTPTATPEVTVTPTSTVTPEVTVTPATTVTPEVSGTAGVAGTPEAVGISEVVGTPETTGTSEGTDASTTTPQVSANRMMMRGTRSIEDYVTLQFEYKELAEVGEQVYQVSYYEKGETLKEKQYALDTERPLVPNVALTGLVKTKTESAGGLEQTAPERFLYKLARYTTPDSTEDVNYGSYKFTPDTEAAAKYRMAADMGLYYTGGFTNNEWFKKNVFDREAAECADVYIKVVTKSAQEVTDTDIASANFIYLSNSSNRFLAYQDTSGTELITSFKNYGETDDGSTVVHDITALRAFYILRQALDLKIPLVSDYSLMESDQDAVKGSIIYYLVRALHMKDDRLQTLYNAKKGAMETATAESEATLKDALEKIASDDLSTTKHYVKGNLYSYYLTDNDLEGKSGTTAYPVISGEFRTAFSSYVVSEHFEEVLKDIENENLYRETDGGRAPLDKTISEATTLRYIINFNYKRAQVQKAKLHILELQPCASWDLSYTNTKVGSKTNGVLYYKKDVPNQGRELINQEDTEIILTQMTTSEFIGKNEDINAIYDMVYIGLNTGLMNTNAAGKTDYNDAAMDGMVYANVGDYIHAEPSLGGMLNFDYINNNRSGELKGRSYYSYTDSNNRIGRYRYSGNDITEEKQKNLEDFIKAGYPVVVEDGMILVDSVTEQRKPNEELVDNSSNMYAFLRNMTGNNAPNYTADKVNLIRLENITSSLFNWYLNLSKPVITMTAGTTAEKSMKQTIPLTQSSDGYYYLLYQFSLTNVGAADANTACDCKLYIDINADGKFSKTKEKIKDIIITDNSGNLQEPNDGGEYSLTPGREYYVKRAVSNEYIGVLPWKIEVTQRGNSSRRAGAMGYFEIKRTEKETVNILQIKTAANNNNVDLAAAMNNEKSMFYHYIKALDSFDLTVTSMDSTEYKRRHDEYYQNGSYKEGEGSVFLNQYDMVILGFSDTYREADNSTGAMTAIRDYIAAGHSVLFTHDTSSISNVPDSQFYANDKYGRKYLSYGNGNGSRGRQNYTDVANFGYSFNTLIRGLVGMDRYGILGPNQEILRRGDIIGNSSGDWNKLTNKSENGKKDIAYVPGSNRTQLTSEVQGFTYLWMNWLRENKRNTFANYKGIPDNIGQYDGQTVTRVNSGQITTYPYTIDETFQVAQTHSQYYQLDLESDEDKDGESDIVVWYTLDDDGTNIANDIYKFSPGDVRNNYYIFNKGNVTYSGVGHSSQERQYFENDYSPSTDANEVKLFINTMIASYRAGLRAPKVSVLDNKEYTSRRIENIYLAYDKQLEDYRNVTEPIAEEKKDGLLDVTENVFFTADQVSFVEGEQALAARYYYECDDGGISLVVDQNEDPIKVKELTAEYPLYRASDEVAASEITVDEHQAYALEASKVYRFAVPTTILPSGKNSARIYIEVTAIHQNTKTGQYEMMSGYGKVSLVRTQMFNLD